MIFSTQTRRPLLFVSIILSFCVFNFVAAADSQAARENPALLRSPETEAGNEIELWQAAQGALLAGNKKKAGEMFTLFHRRYGEADKAEEALWQACRLNHDLALDQNKADWEQVRDLYRLFITEYPDSVRFQEAYLGLGLAYFHMLFYREALIYFNLFLDRFPESSYRTEARYWQGRTLVEIGRLTDAEKNYQELAAGADQQFRIKALEALGDLYFTTDRFPKALTCFQDLLKNIAPYTPHHLELIRKIGFTNARLGHEIASREHLYRYLNVVDDSPHAAAVLFELGESYWRQKEFETARLFYARSLAKGDSHERSTVLSLFRQAQYRSLQAEDLPPWQRKDDDSKAAGDGPYLAVLDAYDREPIAQDARFSLLQRFMARSEFDRAFLLAKNYLNHAVTEDRNQQEVEDILGQVLVARVEDKLAAGDCRQVVALFQDENRHMLAYSKGKLLHLVGQALEELALYQQAGDVYSLALFRELSAVEKVDLQYRRADVFLAQNDLSSADQLLAHLRDVYQGQQEMAEIYHLSGRLREKQGKAEEALAFHKEGCRLLIPEKRADACESQVGLLLQLGRLQEADDTLTGFRRQNWLDAGAMRHLHEEVGDAWRRQGNPERAAAAYVFALKDDLPIDGKQAQNLRLRLGDIHLRLGQFRQAMIHYEQALAGPDHLLRKSAERGFRQADIDQSLVDLRNPLNGKDGNNR